MNCWDFKKCSEDIYTNCPAYLDKGLDCWKVTGTKCDQGKMELATLIEKNEHCRTCDFYE